MNHVHHRRLGGVAAIVVAAGLVAVPTAASADTGPMVLGTTAYPQPRISSTGVRTDACDWTATPGWMARTGSDPTLNATVAGDGSGSLSARFEVWDQMTGADSAVFSGVAPAYAGQARINVPGLLDGHSYTWRTWALQGDRTSAPAPDCHFRVDTTSPTVSVASPDFPADGSGGTATKYAGQVGTFVLNAADPAPDGGEASGVACVRYGFDMLGVGGDCTAPGTVRPGADGTLTLQLKVLHWGTNTLNVEVIDDAGNSGRMSYTFYAPSNPNPPKTLGDVDGDGTADILLPDAQGNLQYFGVNAGDTAPSSTIQGNRAPYGGSWAPFQVAHRGWSKSHAPSSDDLFIHKPGDGYLYLYQNVDYGSFTGYMTDAQRSRSCQDDAGATVACPADFASDWSKADQVVAFGPVTDATSPSLLTLEDGNLWLHAGGNFGFGSQKARKLTTTGDWSGYDLIAPGPDASGSLTLWARERADGTLHAYPVPKQANGLFDFSALADPAAGVVASGFTVGAYPTLGSSGDGDGDGAPDLWAVTADRHLVTYSGWSAPKDLGVLR
ncbi:hypothetical protein [Kitasatospora sp. NPDC087315]|uniref:hypothetical protein n=1 Tax=Kitasatospora sp. NPDC087315 TaxID=3364069 RepID=UPI00381E33F9